MAFIGAMYINVKGKDVYNGQNIDMFRGKKGKKLTNIRHNKELIARTTHESSGYCTYQGPCQEQRQYQEKQGHYQVYKHIYSYIYQAKPHETYQVRVRRKTCLNQAQTVERH